jgi:hypothetical protein
MIPPLIALFAWIPISLIIFWRRPVRQAILIDFIGGWAVLPSANFVPTAARFPYWILGNSLPSDYFFTKASMTALCAVLGVLLFDRRSLHRFRPSLWDLPMLAWCVVPLLSGIANELGIRSILRTEAYQLLAWGTPYVFGRIYFCNADALKLAARAFVIAGLAYIPICILEIFTGPQLYARLYGYEPYRWIGAPRYLGFRPIGLLEDGNQLGIWMATSALIAIWLWRRKLVAEIAGIPIAWAAMLLLAVTIACQSAGSIVLLLGLLPFLCFNQRSLVRALATMIVLGIVALMGLRLTNLVSLRSIVNHSAVARDAAYGLRDIGRGSFAWRLAQDEKNVGTALAKPILGYGRSNWWKGGTSRPWALWLLAFGMYGAVGLLALEGLQFAPLAIAMWSPSARSDVAGHDLRFALAVVILMSAIDNLLNGSMILPLLLLIGGIGNAIHIPGKREMDSDGSPLTEEIVPTR